MAQPLFQRHWRLTFWALLGVLAWDASGLDLVLAQQMGSPQGFALQNHPLLADWLHDQARKLGWGVLALLAFSVYKPVLGLGVLSRAQRASVLVTVLVTLLSVSLLKGVSQTSCPWDLQQFGGTLPYVSHWAWGQTDGGTGHCFPAGHASTGFVFVAVYFWLAPAAPRLALRWLVLALVAGALLGWVQQLRGAHYLSHTLWTAWLCWAIPGACHSLSQRWLKR